MLNDKHFHPFYGELGSGAGEITFEPSLVLPPADHTLRGGVIFVAVIIADVIIADVIIVIIIILTAAAAHVIVQAAQVGSLS